MSHPDGAFHRINASMLHSSDKYSGSVCSIVGKAGNYDGSERLEFECADGGKVTFVGVPLDYQHVPDKVMEVMGAPNEDKTIQVCYVGDDVVGVFE